MAFQSICWTMVALLMATAMPICLTELTTFGRSAHVATSQNNRTNAATNWNRRYQSTDNNQACEYKELLANLHDRIGLLATLDEDLRSRLETIDQKIVQFESSNLARLQSLSAQQMEFQNRLDSMEHIERLTKHEVLELKGDFEGLHKIPKSKRLIELAKRKKDMILNRVTREIDSPQVGIAVNSSEKLDALAVLLSSTRVALNTLQTELQSNLSRLMQQTNSIQKRLNSLQRRQNGLNQGQNLAGGQLYLPPVQPNFYANANAPLVTSCAQGVTTTNSVLKLQLTGSSDPFYVLCDDQDYGGGWTIILNRYNGDINFQRGWQEYKTGFGNLAGDFFIGLEKLHALTASAVHELLIVLEDFQGEQRNARYNLFAIGSEQESYALQLLGAYEGTAGDALTYHAGSKFSTFDNDNDGCVDCNCAQSHMGAWWYNWCEKSNLNGKYYAQDYDKVPLYTGMYWHTFRGPSYSLKAARMMIRPITPSDDRRR